MNNAAILVIEFQKTWTDKGLFHRIIKKAYTSGKILPNTKAVLRTARKRALPVIQAPLILDKADPKRYRKTPFPARLLKRFTQGTWKAEFTDGIYENSDIVVQGRCGFDACEGSNLERLLQENGLHTVYVCGFTTDHCVRETMYSLRNKGFHCVLVSDCTATRSPRLQKRIEKEFETISSTQLVINMNSADSRK